MYFLIFIGGGHLRLRRDRGRDEQGGLDEETQARMGRRSH